MLRIINRSMSLRGHGGGGGGGGAINGSGSDRRGNGSRPGTATGVRVGTRVGNGLAGVAGGVIIHAGDASTHGPKGPVAPLAVPLAAEPGFVSGPTLQTSTVLGLVENADAPAASFPDGRNPYLSRPLPVLPPKVKLSIMPPRPSTSAGKAPSGRSNFDNRRISRDDMFVKSSSHNKPVAMDNRRISRDDMFLGAKQHQGPGSSSSSWRPAFHVPIRGQLPTPDPSPRAASPPTAVALGSSFYSANAFPIPPRRRETPESLRSGEIQIGVQIGMALGSPSHAPSSLAGDAGNWKPQPQELIRQEPPAEAAESSSGLKRSKTGRRKLFGLFGRKNIEPSQPKSLTSSQASRESTESFHPAAKAETSPANHTQGATNSQGSQAGHGFYGQGYGVTDGAAMARSNTSAGGNASKYKPLLVRTNTESYTDSHSPNKEAAVPLPLRPKASEPAFRQQQQRYLGAQSTWTSASSSPSASKATSPFLDVEIPDIKMERYSVMFGSLLNPQHQQASSLLARRQATLDRLRTINDKIVQEEEMKGREKQEPPQQAVPQRRATSPQPAAPTRQQQGPSLGISSPAFTLFPPTPNSRPELAPRKSSPRMRSNTSPAQLPSPSNPTFGHDPMRRDPSKTNFLKVGSAAPVVASIQPPVGIATRGDRTVQTTQTAAQMAQTQEKTVHFEPDHSNLILDSPSSISDREYEVVATARTATSRPVVPQQQPLRPTIPEPQWQMMSPPASAAPSTASSSSGSSTRKRSPSSVSSVRTHVTKPSVEIDEADTALKAAVEISIARQISISRQQRQLLRPLKTTGAAAVGPSASASLSPNGGSSRPRVVAQAQVQGPATTAKTSPVRQLARNERLQEIKFATPTLINPRQTAASQMSSHRKSERVILEAA